MPESMSAARSIPDIPRSPASISTESSRGSQKPLHLGPPTPSSPSSHLTRKRAASLNTDSANQAHTRFDERALNSASTIGSLTDTSSRDQVCFCQPDPKIPRPRNAFILYRQHYQGQIIAQHPGLANPEISKIIGEQWKEQPIEVKDNWKRLAEEEKARHQRQYPGYRYQPRRAGKPGSNRPSSSFPTDEAGRCVKCGGRYISTPSTPQTHFTSAFGNSSRTERIQPPPTPVGDSESALNHPQIQRNRMDSPRMIPPQHHRRMPYPPPHPLHTHAEMDEMELSPGQKRRRFNEPRGYPPSPATYVNAHHYARNGAPISATEYRQVATPLVARSGAMGPPPQVSPMKPHPRQPFSDRSGGFDESLRLPPLQTQLPQLPQSSPSSVQRQELRRESREIQAKSIEAMVMTISYINKIKMLARISPPLASPGPTSPAHEVRGAMIAIEGADLNLVDEVGTFLNEQLRKEQSCYVQTWSSMKPYQKPATATGTATSPTTDIEMVDSGTPVSTAAPNSTADSALQDPFVEYLATISKWHKKSQEINKFITTVPPPSQSTENPSSSNTKLLPIALLPHGFSLTVSDRFALRIPINDSYAPLDHWQWMATLWRGIIGPDLTIFVKRVRDKEEMEKMGGVEMRSDCKGIVVRIPEGSKMMEEQTARRLGFEVLEFVRGMEAGFGRE